MGLFRLGGAAALLMALGFALPASADEDDLNSLLADCNKSDLATSDIPSCMERARVMADTHPSPELQHLLTHLEHRLDDGDSSNKPSTPPATTPPQSLQGAPAAKPPNTSAATNSSKTSSVAAADDPGFFEGAWRSISNLASNLDPSARDPAEEPVPVEITAPDETPAPEMEGGHQEPPSPHA